jgi:hypothetical protein
MSKALGLPCVWIGCKFGDNCRNEKYIWIHSWQKAEFRAADLPWDLIHYYNEDLLPPHAFEMPLMGSALQFNQATNRNGWRSPKSSHIDQMYGNKAHITRTTKIVPDYDTIATSPIPCFSTRWRASYASESENNLRMLYTPIFLADSSDAIYSLLSSI